MIDRLPLDLFGDGGPEPEPELEPEPEPSLETETQPESPDSRVTAVCQWCAADVDPDATTCPACDARIVPAEPSAPARHDGVCRWCGAAIAPENDTCPACGWDARGENQIEIPGLTIPLTESQIRSLYGGDDPEPEADIAADVAADIAIGIIGAFLPRG